MPPQAQVARPSALSAIDAAGAGSRIVMLLYSLIQSPGYFLARHELAPVVMFAVLAVLAVVAIVGTASL